MNHALASNRSLSLREKVVDYLSLERNVAIASAAVFLLGFGEELWKKFLPKYLEALGASTPIIGLFGTAEDFFDAIYQYPGGWIADHLGRRRAFLIFIGLSAVDSETHTNCHCASYWRGLDSCAWHHRRHSHRLADNTGFGCCYCRARTK